MRPRRRLGRPVRWSWTPLASGYTPGVLSAVDASMTIESRADSPASALVVRVAREQVLTSALGEGRTPVVAGGEHRGEEDRDLEGAGAPVTKPGRQGGGHIAVTAGATGESLGFPRGEHPESTRRIGPSEGSPAPSPATGLVDWSGSVPTEGRALRRLEGAPPFRIPGLERQRGIAHCGVPSRTPVLIWRMSLWRGGEEPQRFRPVESCAPTSGDDKIKLDHVGDRQGRSCPVLVMPSVAGYPLRLTSFRRPPDASGEFV